MAGGAWQGACLAGGGGSVNGGLRAWQKRRPLGRYASYWNALLWFFSSLRIILFLPSYREQTTSGNGDDEDGDRPNQEDQGKKDVQSPINCSN